MTAKNKKDQAATAQSNIRRGIVKMAAAGTAARSVLSINHNYKSGTTDFGNGILFEGDKGRMFANRGKLLRSRKRREGFELDVIGLGLSSRAFGEGQ